MNLFLTDCRYIYLLNDRLLRLDDLDLYDFRLDLLVKYCIPQRENGTNA